MSHDYSDRNPELASLYPAHVAALCARHDHALANAGAAHAVIFAGFPKTVFLDDRQYPFKANAHFLSWAPLPTLPLSYIVYSPGETPRLSSTGAVGARLRIASNTAAALLPSNARLPVIIS